MRQTMRERPGAVAAMSCTSPLRCPTASKSAPRWPAATSNATDSNGSKRRPPSSRKITAGCDTANSNPSRRMVSINTERCNSPRPDTSNRLGSAVSATRNATLCAASRVSRAFKWRLVRNLPSRPANGLVFTQNVMVSVGSSTRSGGRPSTAAGSQRVSDTPTSSTPAKHTMSPAVARGSSTRASPWLE